MQANETTPDGIRDEMVKVDLATRSLTLSLTSVAVAHTNDREPDEVRDKVKDRVNHLFPAGLLTSGGCILCLRSRSCPLGQHDV